jgi:hypothetical protein
VPLTFLHSTIDGKMRSKKALGNDFAGWVKAAGLPDKCRMHGLKKGGMRRGAEAKLTMHELMAKSGHKSLAMVQLYTDEANEKLLADSGAEKEREARENRPKLDHGENGRQNGNRSEVTNTADPNLQTRV